MKRLLHATLAVGLVLAVAACRSGAPKEDPMLALSAEEALEIGKRLMEEEKYRRAGEHFTHAFEVEPNSASGREGLLLAADALYLDDRADSYVKAEAKYRDFLNRFPTSDRAAYVQYQRANCLAARLRKPDRDQSLTREALDAYRELIRLYPDSEYADEARQQIARVKQNLAAHEMVVGRFNYRFKLYPAAVARLQTILDDYPDYEEIDRALYYLGLALAKLERNDEADQVFERLRSEHPESSFVGKLPKKGAT